MTRDPAALTALGRRVLELEAREIEGAASRLDGAFARAVALLAAAKGRVIVSGVGKSGLIARKIAATLTSTGTPATYLHPVDSLHGDLGIVGREDVAILLSKSGETEELFGLLTALQRLNVPIIALTGGADSTLAKVAREVLDAGVAEEACPHDLAPTTSTAVALALGDALAVALLEVKGFKREDFAELHPGGSLGRRLLLRARDVMLPPQGILPAGATMRECVVALARHRGLAIVAEGGTVHGVVTAGDLSRLAQSDAGFLDRLASEVMTSAPKSAASDELAAAVLGRMERHGIMAMPVLDDRGELAGVIHLHDLMRAGAGVTVRPWLRAALVLTGMALAAACNRTGASPGVLGTAADTADQTLFKVRHIITRDGVQKSLVEADTAYYYEGSQTFELRVVTVTFYDKDGTPTSTLTSNEGTYQTMTGVMEGRGKVVVRSTDGTRVLKSEQLTYDPGRNEISSEVFYTYDQGSNHLEGVGFTSDPNIQRTKTGSPRGRADEGIILPGQ